MRGGRILRGMPNQHAPRISVRSSSTGIGLWCDEPVACGCTIIGFDGEVRQSPGRYSIQVGQLEHLHPDDGAVAAGDRSRFAWRFLNHSCAPNCRVDGRRLVACRDLAAGEQLSFDYNATEWSLAEPFRCACGACGGEPIRGFAHLDAASRERRRPWLARHLMERLGDAGA
ncbi:MAG: hypothetical protein RLZZ217_1205 [Planctomycetota bacterium]